MPVSEPQAIPDGPSGVQVSETLLGDVLVEDTTFQYRLEPAIKDLLVSLRAHGQREPIDLLGSSPPYRIIDGFRRVAALRELNQVSVKAIRHDIDDEQGHRVAFVKNVVRKNLSAFEKALAIHKALQRQRKREEIAQELHLSVKQLLRYIELGSLPSAVQDAVQTFNLTMAHAKVLKDFDPNEPNRWAERCAKESWSSKHLRRQLRKELGIRGGRQKQYVRRVSDALRFYPCRVSKDDPPEERRRAITALREAIQFLEEL